MSDSEWRFCCFNLCGEVITCLGPGCGDCPMVATSTPLERIGGELGEYLRKLKARYEEDGGTGVKAGLMPRFDELSDMSGGAI